MKSCYLLPEGAVAGSEERVFPGIPTQEMRRMHVLGVRFAASPDFVKQIAPGRIHGAVQIEGEAALFFSGRTNERAQLGFQEEFLALARTQNHD